MPVGTTREHWRDAFAAVAGGRRVGFAYSPEESAPGQGNRGLRAHPERIVVGTADDHARAVLEPMLAYARFCARLIWVSVRSAELAKHSLNAFLAVSVTFMNEIATLCEQVGADAAEVELALRSEPRIGTRALYPPRCRSSPAGPLARDIMTLNQLRRAP